MPSENPRPDYAPGTVLLVDGEVLLAPEVAPLTDDILELYPEYSKLHARRLALTNEWLPRLACRARYAEAWKAAREACAQATDGLEESAARPVEGTFQGLGVGFWSAVRHLPIGTWSPPIELVGRWIRVRLEERVEHPEPREELLKLSLLEFPYVAPAEARQAIDSAIDGARLSLVDPEFAEAVPETWKHRMRGSQP